MPVNRIDRAVRDAQHALEIARMRKDKRKEGEALARLQAARTRQMRRDRRRKIGQFSPEAIAAARAGLAALAKVAVLGFYLAGVAGLAIGAQTIIGA